MTGVIVQIMDEVDILSKKGQKKEKKEIVLADDSNHEVSLVLWENYQNEKFKLGSIVTIKNGKVCFLVIVNICLILSILLFLSMN